MSGHLNTRRPCTVIPNVAAVHWWSSCTYCVHASRCSFFHEAPGFYVWMSHMPVQMANVRSCKCFAYNCCHLQSACIWLPVFWFFHHVCIRRLPLTFVVCLSMGTDHGMACRRMFVHLIVCLIQSLPHGVNPIR